MSIFIDTADIEQAKAAKELGWIHGITTNPILLAKSGSSAADTLQQLAEYCIKICAMWHETTSGPVLNQQTVLLFRAFSVNSHHLYKDARQP